MKVNHSLVELKKHMSAATNVQHWNLLRREAKKLFPFQTLCELDASGYIKEVLPNESKRSEE